jgi:hypothetical protein
MNLGWRAGRDDGTAAVTAAASALGVRVVSAEEACDLTLIDARSDFDPATLPEAVPRFLLIDPAAAEDVVRGLRTLGCGVVRTTALAADLQHAIRLTTALAEAAPRRMRLPPLLVRAEICHRLPNDLTLAFAWAGEVWREAIERLEWLPAHAAQLASAAAEAAGNAILRGNLEISPALADAGDAAIVEQLVTARRRQSPFRERSVWASCRFSAEEVRIVIRDEGPGFTSAPDWPAGVAAPALGRGGLVLRALCREVRYNAEGNEVTLVLPSQDEPLSARSPSAVESSVITS